MSERQATVLFADVSGSSKLYETAGNAAALEAISACLKILRDVTESSGGQVVKTIGDEIMSLFPGPDHAANAAAEMQVRMEAMVEVAGTKLGVRIGFHHGPVLQQQDDVFGDSVNLASRLAAQAKGGEIITSAETAAQLGAIFRTMVRHLYAITIRGRTEEVGLAELMWKRDADATVHAGMRPSRRSSSGTLRLVYRGREVVRRKDGGAVKIGRDTANDLVIDDEMASRNHCTIERRQDKFVLRDHSTNGTFVTIEGDLELVLRREEVTLRKRGWIAFGQPRSGGVIVAEFFCD